MRKTLLAPGMIQGMATTPDPMSLPDSILALGQNVRLSVGPIKARNGDATIKSNIASGTVRGAYSCIQDGTTTLFVALGNGTKITIYKSTDDGATWTSISPSSGAYGDTRLTDSTTVPIRFCCVKDNPINNTQTAYDLVLIQNGTDSPRLYGKGLGAVYPASSGIGSGTYGMAVQYQPPVIADSPNLITIPYFSEGFAIGQAGAAFTGGTGIAMANTYIAPSNTILLTVNHSAAGTPYVLGQTATADFTSDIDFSKSKQLIILGSGTDTAWPKKLVITLKDTSGNSATVYSYPDGIGEVTQAAVSSPFTNVVLAAYSLPQNNTIDWSSIDKILIGYSEVPTGSNATVELIVVAASGAYQGGARFAVSNYMSDTRSESAANIITNINTSYSTGLSGGPQADITLALTYPAIPEDPRFWYDYRVVSPDVSTTARDAGVDYGLVYLSEYGQSGYYYLGCTPHNVYNYGGGGVWHYNHASANLQYWQFSAVGAKTTPNQLQDLSKMALSANAVCLPTGTAMAVGGNRTFVGSSSRFYYSQVDRPFVFRLAAESYDDGSIVPTSAASFVLDGQTVQAIVALGALSGSAESLSTPIVGGSTIMVLTEDNLYALAGYDALSLNRPNLTAPYGTYSPMSIVRSQYGFAWLDHKAQIRFFDGRARSLSTDVVSDRLETIPVARKVWVTGAAGNDRLHWGYTPSGGSTNTKALVYNERLQTWESEDSFSGFTAGFLVPFYSTTSGYLRLFVFDTVSSNGACYEYAQPSNTGNVSLRIKFKEFTSAIVNGEPFVDTIVSKGIGIMSSKGNGSTLTVATDRTFKMQPNSTTTTGSVSVGGTPTLIWYWDTDGVGGEGATVQPEISGTVAGGTVVYSVVGEFELGQEGIRR